MSVIGAALVQLEAKVRYGEVRMRGIDRLGFPTCACWSNQGYRHFSILLMSINIISAQIKINTPFKMSGITGAGDARSQCH